MIQLNPNKRRKDKEERENAAKKSKLRIVTPGQTWKRFKGDVGKAWKGTKKVAGQAKDLAEKGRNWKVTIPTHASNKAKNAAKKAEAAKPKKSTAASRARAANVARHGEKAISGLQAKNKDFQKMKKGGITKADFIKKYPNSQTAKKAAKRKPRAQRGGRK